MKKKIAIAVAAVAIVLAGVMYWQSQKTDSTRTNASNQKLYNREGAGSATDSSENRGISPNTTPRTKETERNTKNTAIKYIYVKEWGVRFKLTDDLVSHRISYKLNDSSIKNSILILDESYKESDCIASGLVRTDLPNYQPDDSDGKNTGTFTLINGKYYERIDGKVLCSSDSELNSPAVEVQNILYKSMESLEKY